VFIFPEDREVITMELPKELEPLRHRKIWVCYPMIWNDKKHGGVGGYDKPPINPYTLKNGSTDNPEHLATFDEAAAQIGKTAYVHSRDYVGQVEVMGVGIALTGTGIIAFDLDNVADPKRHRTTAEAGEIIALLDSYTEVSPSGTGVHVIAFGKLPDSIGKKVAKKVPDIFHNEKEKQVGEYQILDAGYVAISGEVIGKHTLTDCTGKLDALYDTYFVRDEEVPPAELSRQKPSNAPSVVSSGATGYTYERWLVEVAQLSDAEILERIFMSGSTGEKVKALYEGNTSLHGGNHSEADLALCSLLYGFTSDRALTERLFRSSGLYREPGRKTGKSKNYVGRTLNRAERQSKQLVGHIEFTREEKKAYAQKKELEEDTREAKRLGYASVEEYRSSYIKMFEKRG